MSILSRPHFHDEEAAFAEVEWVMWPDGTEGPHCGAVGAGIKVKANPERRIRHGLWKCADCKKQFTVKVGTVFEASKVPLHKWLQAVYLMTSSKKGVSAHQLHRGLEITYKTAWFMAHRIREAMRSGALAPFGADGGTVEVDETFIGHDRSIKPKGEKKDRGYAHIPESRQQETFEDIQAFGIGPAFGPGEDVAGAQERRVRDPGQGAADFPVLHEGGAERGLTHSDPIVLKNSGDRPTARNLRTFVLRSDRNDLLERHTREKAGRCSASEPDIRIQESFSTQSAASGHPRSDG